MKVKFSYLPAEEAAALEDVETLKKLHPSAKVKTSDRHPPYNHIYFSVSEQKSIEVIHGK